MTEHIEEDWLQWTKMCESKIVVNGFRVYIVRCETVCKRNGQLASDGFTSSLCIEWLISFGALWSRADVRDSEQTSAIVQVH